MVKVFYLYKIFSFARNQYTQPTITVGELVKLRFNQGVVNYETRFKR